MVVGLPVLHLQTLPVETLGRMIPIFRRNTHLSGLLKGRIWLRKRMYSYVKSEVDMIFSAVYNDRVKIQSHVLIELNMMMKRQ